MSISRRIATLFRVKANKALDRAEDPREVLDYSYEQQLEMVQKVPRELAALGFALPGTLADRMTRCGRANCRCHADPPRLHGPYHQWTRKKDGKTATRILTDDQLADYGPWFGNHRRLRELIAELEALSLDIAEADPRWNR